MPAFVISGKIVAKLIRLFLTTKFKEDFLKFFKKFFILLIFSVLDFYKHRKVFQNKNPHITKVSLSKLLAQKERASATHGDARQNLTLNR